MRQFNPLEFQKEAIDKLSRVFVDTWKKSEKKLPIVLKAPTGSGKTFIVANFIRGLNHLPQWQNDKAFIWITFSDDLAMQSKDKFAEYFENNLENNLITVDDIDRKKLFENDIIFLNWQKVVSKSAETRVLRRPDEEIMRKEKGAYWEDFVDGTHADNREIVLVIDEAHKNKNTTLAKEIIDYINPKVILHITATPDKEDELEAYRMGSMVEVDRLKVIAQGLIKEKVVVQTEEDLTSHQGQDLDRVLLDLGVKRREELKKELEQLGKDVNPLMLIQLPNDDNRLIEMDKETKESVVCDYLKEIGIPDRKIAKWFDGRQENMELITENDSEVDYMLFKQAAGTGWDCPRASVLVMFREIRSDKFYTQTVGRILRMPEPELKEDYKNNEQLRIGYLYTNYKRNQVELPDKSDNNKPYVHFSNIKDGIENIELQSEYISRVDYGDIPKSYKFQQSFIESMNNYFDINNDDILGKAQKKLEAKKVDLSGKLTNQIIVNAEFEDFDHLNYEFNKEGRDLEIEMSTNDVEKTFNYICYQLLQEQDNEEAKYTNIARSWSTLKSAIRIWLKKTISEDSDYFYRVFVRDINKGASSKFRPAITKALIDFKPIAKQILDEKKVSHEKKEAPVFTIQDEYSFTEDYVAEDQKLCALNEYYVLKDDYKGKKNEMDFKNYIDGLSSSVKWWFKNGDYGKIYYALKYMDTIDQKEALFYPDWIIRFRDGRIGIFDTKDGDTAKSQETKDKAMALSKKLKELGGGYVGGIVIKSSGIWYYNDAQDYDYHDGNIEQNKNWKKFESLV
ncbi:MAG: DEAD/DEAH box helicase family protein [Patescibacteria group bacterium]|nr:DEAD/DEAH box helicase family protein [Patescibacteria group bacterium]